MTQPRDERAIYPYMPNQRVKFHLNGTQGSGSICGMVTQYMSMPVVGTLWIVRLDQPLNGYSYDCISIASIHLEPLEPM